MDLRTSPDSHSLNLATRRVLGNHSPSPWVASRTGRYPETGERTRPERERRFVRSTPSPPGQFCTRFGQIFGCGNGDYNRIEVSFHTVNDPSAGSPTETLLRLLLSPSDRVRASSRSTVPALARQTETNPRPSLNRSIDSSDGRCVQRAGT